MSKLAANTLIGVDTCPMLTDADALTIPPLQLVQEANGYSAKKGSDMCYLVTKVEP